MFTNDSPADMMEGYLLTFGAAAPLVPGETAPADVQAQSAEEGDTETVVPAATANTDVTNVAAGT